MFEILEREEKPPEVKKVNEIPAKTLFKGNFGGNDAIYFKGTHGIIDLKSGRAWTPIGSQFDSSATVENYVELDGKLEVWEKRS